MSRIVKHNKNILYNIIIYVISPIFSLLITLYYFSDRHQRKFIYLFFISFGFCYTYWLGGDSIRTARSFSETADLSATHFWAQYISGWTFQEGLDLYQPITEFLISRFTDEPTFYFVFQALVYGFFMMGAFKLLYDEFPVKKQSALIILLFFLFFAFIHRIGYVRFYIAMWIFVYFVFMYYKYGGLKYVILSSFSILVHFTFIGPFLMFLFTIFRKSYINLIFVIFLFSLFFQNYLGDILLNYVNPQAFIGELASRVESYTGDRLIERRRESLQQTFWYAAYKMPVMHFFFNMFLIAMFFVVKKHKINDYFQIKLFSMSLLLMSFFNITTSGIGAAERFIVPAGIFILAFFYRHLCLYNTKYNDFIYKTSLIPLSYWFMLELHGFLNNTTLFLYFGNFLFYKMLQDSESVYNIFKNLLLY